MLSSASSTVALSSRTLTTPCLTDTLSAREIAGRRRSASIRITRLPAAASELARLIAVVVLPSDGEEPVIRIALEVSRLPRRLAARVPRRVR